MLRIVMKHACMVAVLAAFPLFCPAQDKPTAIPLLPAANWVQIDSHSLPLSAIGNYGGESAVEAEYGVKTLELLGVDVFNPRDHSGQKVVVKGVLIQGASKSRVNVTSLQTLAAACD